MIDKLKVFFEKYFGIGGSSGFSEQESKVMAYDFENQEQLQKVAEMKIKYEKDT